MGVESYKHKAAKSVLAEWLRENIKENGGHELNYGWVSCSPNRGGEPSLGVFEEYPIVAVKPTTFKLWNTDYLGLMTWDEECWERYLHLPESGGIPSYEQCKKLERAPLVIFDIGIIHKGNLRFGLEVVNKNDISPTKRERIVDIEKHSCSLGVFKLDAEWILSQTCRPKKLNLTWVWGQ